MADAGDVARMRKAIALWESWDILVVQFAGWETLGLTWARVPWGIVDHHDASTIKSGEWGSIGVIRFGRTGIPAPLASIQIPRCLDFIPKIGVVAAGRANHAGIGGPKDVGGRVVPQDLGNSYLYGVEKANDGLGEVANAAMEYATNACFRGLLEVCG